MKAYSLPHIRLGATSFLLHADYVPAVRFVAERCDDLALLLVETGLHGEALPSPEDIAEIGRICAGEGTSLHVHLPTDANFETFRGVRTMVAHARAAIERAAPLDPHSFVLHVDFPSLHGILSDPTLKGLSDEQFSWTQEALADIAASLPSPEQLAIENLETFPTSFWDGWLKDSPYSRCLDIGHIWKDGGDPTTVLQTWLPQVRVIHLHGLEGCHTVREEQKGQARTVVSAPRDHKSLGHMPPQSIDAVLHPLWQSGFPGVLNLEVFSVDDFSESHTMLIQSWERFVTSESYLAETVCTPK